MWNKLFQNHAAKIKCSDVKDLVKNCSSSFQSFSRGFGETSDMKEKVQKTKYKGWPFC